MDDAWQFVELTPGEAAAVLDWRYDGRYAFHDTAADPEFAAEFAAPDLWKLRELESDRDVLLAVRDSRGEFAGFFAFKGSRERCVIGLGLAPAFTGRSLGTGFVRAGLAFARRRWDVVSFSLEVAAFNMRAVAVYERLGFVETGRVSRAAPELAGEKVEFIEMAVASRGVGTVWIERPVGSAEGVLGVYLGEASSFGRGIGTAAVELAVAEFRDAHPRLPVSLRVRRTNERALACYRDAGFTIAGTGTKSLPSGGPVAYYRMVLPARVST